MPYKKAIYPLFILIAIGIFLYATYLTFLYYRLSNYGVVSEATVKTVSSYNPPKGYTVYKLSMEFIDNNKTYTTDVIETTRKAVVRERLNITYDKFHPERANLTNNNYGNPTIYWITFFFISFLLYRNYDS